MGIQNNLHNFGCVIQKPMNWGIEQFKPTPSKEYEKTTKVTNIALKALTYVGAVFAILLGAIPYGIGAGITAVFKKSSEGQTVSEKIVVSENKSEKVKRPKLRVDEDGFITATKTIKRENVVSLKEKNTEQLTDEQILSNNPFAALANHSDE
jgi:hypothetical protein